MLDIKLIRENPEKINNLLKRRDENLSIDDIYELDKNRRKIQIELDNLRNKRKIESQKIGVMKKTGENANKIQEDVRVLGDEIKKLEDIEKNIGNEIRNKLLNIPNIPQESTNIGKSEADNVVIKKVFEPRRVDFEIKPHWDIATEKGLVDFNRGVKISQSRFSLYTGLGAKLERSIINFFLDLHTQKHGYREMMPPILVNSNAMIGTGQLPKFKEDMYKCENEDLYLISTAEVPITNVYSNEILNEEDLPILMTAYTPCFRREAGSAGKDTRGLIRQHQFNKVELVKLTLPENSDEEHIKLTQNAQRVLELLELPYRVVELSTGDMGFSANKCYDLEVWLPSYNNYKEISSCSNFGDYQARRANIRYKSKNSGKINYVHTLNGSGLAVGRTFAAILENYQNEDGSITIPKVIQPYMGVDKI